MLQLIVCYIQVLLYYEQKETSMIHLYMNFKIEILPVLVLEFFGARLLAFLLPLFVVVVSYDHFVSSSLQ